VIIVTLLKQFTITSPLPEHIQSEISRGLYFTRTRIDITLLKSANHQVAENRVILKVIIDALLFTARQNIAYSHDESHTSMNKGNFLELLKLSWPFKYKFTKNRR